ncbi:hypothetical protein F5Y00DRAFT_263953 [Daldinia vernicosa]|uniref:uncharacterized protein n=1 Tax=Daldinia vernicosa TaxID=114800 RepID=UPI002008C47C|nr:uncharacterized protein F5Y00DRAFT_263953 [Daldinia vernicosa]KAI0847138.1 hypothetical protein F5Y00DRAFT_263953 [Daldinia vernicosa]
MDTGYPTAPAPGCQSQAANTANMANNQPESSPYAGPQTTLQFQDGLQFAIPTSLYKKFFEYEISDFNEYLMNFPGDCGHVIVHFLYTGTYQYLKLKGTCQCEKDKDIDEFITCAQVYKIAGDCLLFPLKKLVRVEMERLGGRLQVTQLLNAMKDVYLTLPDTDKWLRNFLKSLVERLIENPSIPIELGDSQSLGHHTSIASFLVGTAIELCREKVHASQRGHTTVVTIQGHLHEAQARGSEHLEPKLLLDQNSQKDQNAKVKSEEDEELQGLKNGGNTLPLHPVGGTSSNNVKEPKAPANPNNEEMFEVPLTTGAKTYYDLPEAHTTYSFERLLTVCAEERFRKFSPEELRWKQMVWERDHPEGV